jgi:flagellar export protein FliJ
MQRFQFRLDRVLEWRRKEYRVEEMRLAACLALVKATELKIERLLAERASIEHDLLHRSSIPAADFLNLGRYRLRAAKEEVELAEERRRHVATEADRRVRVQRAQQRVKLLEKMRERRFEEHTAAASRELESLAAEAYLARWSQSHRAD